MKKYRKKPLVIEAIHYDGSNSEELGIPKPEISFSNYDIFIETIEGTIRAEIGDYIVKGTQGEFYPIKPHIFEANYEEVIE